MQILMTKAAFERVGARLATVAPVVEVVTSLSADAYERDGQPISVEDVNPEVVWLSLDSYASGTLGPLFGRLMKTEAPRWTQIMAAGIDNPMFRSIMEKGVRISKSSGHAHRRIRHRPRAEPAGSDPGRCRPAGEARVEVDALSRGRQDALADGRIRQHRP